MLSLVVAVGVAAAANPVVVEGWNSAPTAVQQGQALSDSVRVRPVGQRVVRLQSAAVGSTKWRTAMRATTTKRGRVTVRIPTDVAGHWRYRLSVTGARKTTPVRRVVVRASPSPVGEPTTVYVAGDIGLCPSAGGTPDKTASLIDAPVIAPGDLAYPSGTATEFANCYDPYWGALKDLTYPVPGNHEYYSGAKAYFAYFGDRVGTPEQPWYTVSLGTWRFYMLNSNCDAVGGCQVGSPQYKWLARQLAQPQPRCTAAVWHHPRWSSGQHGPYTGVGDLYALLEGKATEVLLTGHEHNYERFAPMSASGATYPGGIRQFVVGTGGQTMRPFAEPAAGSMVRLNDSTGVLRMQLSATGYSWEFIPTTPGAGADAGSDVCR